MILGQANASDLYENGGEIGGDHRGEEGRLRPLPKEGERGKTETRAPAAPNHSVRMVHCYGESMGE
jgi:hypothetical protein